MSPSSTPVRSARSSIDRLCKKLSGRGSLRFVYEAGPCGFWLQRYLAGKGYDCVVAASSLIPKKPGDRIKTDRRDARNLALALRAGTLSFVHIPTPDQEQFRDVVRALQQSKRDVTEAAWAYRYTPKVSRIIEARAQDIDPDIRGIAWKAQLRLNHVYKKLMRKGKHKNVLITAIARELSAFIWDAARVVDQRV